MRQDQYERLQALQERLIDTAIAEADPKVWPGEGIPIATMDKDTRGDRYWCKKNAVATIGLALRIDALIGRVHESGIGTTPTQDTGAEDADTNLDAEVKAAEREAARLLDELQKKQRKAAFDAHIHGRR